MNFTKNVHPRPEAYRIIFRVGNWVTRSKRYYSVFHSSEALEDIYHTFITGHIPGKKITIYDIQEYDRFVNEWISRKDLAVENTELYDTDFWSHVEMVKGNLVITIDQKKGPSEEGPLKKDSE